MKGMIGWDDMKHIARVVGFVNPDIRYFWYYIATITTRYEPAGRVISYQLQDENA